MRICPSTTGGPKQSFGTGVPCRVSQQRRAAAARTRTTPRIKNAIKNVLRETGKKVLGARVSGQKISRIERTPAVIVVVPTKSMGRAVIHAYFFLPMLIKKVVLTASAMVARSWFPVPNIGHNVEIEPV